jgi:hypothetical protein
VLHRPVETAVLSRRSDFLKSENMHRTYLLIGHPLVEIRNASIMQLKMPANSEINDSTNAQRYKRGAILVYLVNRSSSP